MSVHPILLWSHNSDVLNAPSAPIDFCIGDEPEQRTLVKVLLAELVFHLTETLWASAAPPLRGVAISAPQIGVGLRVAVIDVTSIAQASGEKKPELRPPLILVNPFVLSSSGKKRESEGCLSFPTLAVHVDRPATVSVSYQDVDGKLQIIEASGLLARCLAHEIDHLDGRVIAHRCGAGARDQLNAKVRRLARRNHLDAAYLPGAGGGA
jgi:peptide deformylase